jgi:hypothetical protein
MKILRALLTGVLGLAFILSFADSWRTRRSLSQMTQELHQITDANDGLRKTVGELTVAITQREQEIDRLHSLPCKSPQEEQHGLVPLPRSRKKADRRQTSTKSVVQEQERTRVSVQEISIKCPKETLQSEKGRVHTGSTLQGSKRPNLLTRVCPP